MYRKYPHLVAAMAQRHEVYNATMDYIDAQEADGKIFVLRPDSPLPVSRVEKSPDKLRVAYEIGRKAAAAKMAALDDFLS